MIRSLTSHELVRGLGTPVERMVNAIVKEFPTVLDAAGHYARGRCTACSGDGYVTVLQRAGATEKEPRTARVCGCARKKIFREAERRVRAAAAGGAPEGSASPPVEGEA